MKLEVAKDRLEINKIIENCLPLMIKNKNLTQECSDCIILYLIEKMEKENMKERLDYYKKQKERSPTNYGRMYWDGRIDELKLNSQNETNGK